MRIYSKLFSILFVLEIFCILASLRNISVISLAMVCSWISFRFFNTCLPTEVKRFTTSDFELNPLILISGTWYIICVVFPIALANTSRISYRPLPFPAEQTYIAKSIFLNIFFMICSLIGIRAFFRINRKKTLRVSSRKEYFINGKLVEVVLFCLGFIGILFLFKALGWNLSKDSIFLNFLGNSSSWTKFLAIILTPLLFHGALFRFSQFYQLKRASFFHFLLTIFCLLPLISFKFNRTILVLPILIMILALIDFRKVTPKLMFSFFAICGVLYLLIKIGDIRSQVLVSQGGRLSLDSAGYKANPSVWETFSELFFITAVHGFCITIH